MSIPPCFPSIIKILTPFLKEVRLEKLRSKFHIIRTPRTGAPTKPPDIQDSQDREIIFVAHAALCGQSKPAMTLSLILFPTFSSGKEKDFCMLQVLSLF